MAVDTQAWMSVEDPNGIALRAVGFIANSAPERDRFLSRSGLLKADLGRRPLNQQHLVAILDFLIGDEAALTKFARAADIPLEAAYEVRRRCRHPIPENGH